MPDMPESYYNTFDPDKNYESLLYRDGYTLQGAELNAMQSASRHRLQGVADALFKDGDIIRDAQISIDKGSGQVRAGSGAIYLKGAVRGVPEAEFTIPTTGTSAVGVRLVERVISELEDPALYNPAIGSRGEGEPGAWRLRVTPAWGHDGDGGEGEFYPVYTVENGEVLAREAPPTMDAFTQGLARYDRDSTAGGSYVVTGLDLQRAGDDAAGNQVYTLSEGRARVNGYGVDVPTSKRLTYPAVPDLRFVDTEITTADGSGTQRVIVAHAPIHSVTQLRVTRRFTESIVHGGYSGAADALPHSSVVSIVECRQGETVYTPTADYRKTGDTVDWSPPGNEPAPGSTFLCVFDAIVAADPVDQDYDGFTVENAVSGSSIIYSYNQSLPRVDRLCLTQDGGFLWLKGVSAEYNSRPPTPSDGLLALATVYQDWRGGPGQVVNDGSKVVSFDDLEALRARLDYALAEIARQRLEADVYTREAGARVGIFVDPLLGDDMRDQGIEQSAAVVGGELLLPIAANASFLPNPPAVAVPAYTPVSQVMRYGIACGLIFSNPARDLTWALTPKKHKPRAAITEPRQIGQLMKDIEHYRPKKRRYSLKLAVLTFVRPGELCRAEWSEMEWEAAVWRIPAHKMKMKRPHIVPLSRQAQDALRALQAVTGKNRWLFPSRWDKNRHEKSMVLNTALRRMGYGCEAMTAHGFRAMAATTLSEQGWPSEAIERQLAHVDKNQVRAAYQRSELLAERRKMMQAWADFLDMRCAWAILGK
ncbi:MAG: DUF4815 domain-containing protein [Desulfovibrio sp.]|jgi:integrase|nr:DUF4815 domain-containing protein [Desulfovibrio sp.]